MPNTKKDLQFLCLIYIITLLKLLRNIYLKILHNQLKTPIIELWCVIFEIFIFIFFNSYRMALILIPLAL